MIPQHIAIIMDGNRRFAKKAGFPIKKGHTLGGEQLEVISDAAADLGVKTLTAFAFSTENWRRSKVEVNVLMRLLEDFLKRKRPKMVEKGVRFATIGDLAKLNKNLRAEIERTVEATKEGSRINLVVGLNYGGRDEIVRATKKMMQDTSEGNFSIGELTEEKFAGYLDTHPWGDPDLLIRPGGEMRVSNFLLWQMSYAEIYVTEKLWPEFGPEELKEAINVYGKRHRRGGE